MNLIFLTPSFGTALCPVMQPSPPFCLSLYSTLALSMNSVFSCVIIVSVQLWNLNCTHLYLLISLAITSVELMKGSLPDASTWYFVRKRTFHHFMSTSATEKSLHYCLFPRNCAIFMSPFFAFILFSIMQYEMLTGSLPFQGENRKATMTMILK